MSPVTATVTFSADDSTELAEIFTAIGEALRAVGAGESVGLPASQAAVEPTPVADTPASPADWYRQHGRQFAERLRPNALTALQVIIREGPTVPFQRVRDELGLEGPRLAGTLASIGAAVSGMAAPAPPFRPDHKRQVYGIDPDVQVALRDVLA